MANLVLLPTSRFVDPEMQLEVGRIPPALIPIQGKPLYSTIVNSFRSLRGTTEFKMIVSEGEQLVADSLTLHKHDNVGLVSIPKLGDLGSAILEALRKIDLSACANLFLNFGDTVVEAELNLDCDAIYYSDLNESFRWTTFHEKNGRIVDIVDKGVVDSSERCYVFTGVFLVKNPALFLRCMEEASSEQNLGRFYVGLRNYLDQVEYRLIKVETWHDFGHVDNYYQERKRSLNHRFFNQVEVDEQRAIITKRSDNFEKFSGEIKWYLELPTGLKCYIPQIFDFSLTGAQSYLKMEFYGYPTLGELFLANGRSLGIWNHVFDRIFNLVSEMSAYRFAATSEQVLRTTHEMYITKTVERLEELRSHPIFSQFFTGNCEINGASYPSLNETIKTLKQGHPLLLPRHEWWNIIHGDLCLSNILFDPRHRIIKVVDPRGRFGESTIYGDSRYDLAKLSHSFNGRYENIVGDLFFALCEQNSISYSIQSNYYQDSVRRMFNQKMKEHYAEQLEAVALIESLLFLSMLPLHGDHLNRQIVMLATGIEKFWKIVRPNGKR